VTAGTYHLVIYVNCLSRRIRRQYVAPVPEYVVVPGGDTARQSVPGIVPQTRRLSSMGPSR
jgi:hypothetical protein